MILAEQTPVTEENPRIACELVRAEHAEDWPYFSGGYYAKVQRQQREGC